MIRELTTNQIEWNAPCFLTLVKSREIEESGQIQEIEDGVHQCHKCGKWKTFSTHLQTRSADEGTTVFVKCADKKCGVMWKIYN